MTDPKDIVSRGSFHKDLPVIDSGMVAVSAGMFAEAKKAVEKEKEKEYVRTSYIEAPAFVRWFNTQDKVDCEDLATLMGLVSTEDPLTRVYPRQVSGKTETWDTELGKTRLFLAWTVAVMVSPEESGRMNRQDLIKRYMDRLPEGMCDWITRS